jgi:hypothetical protein
VVACTLAPVILARPPIDHWSEIHASYPTPSDPPNPFSDARVLPEASLRARTPRPRVRLAWNPPCGSGYQSTMGPSTPRVVLASLSPLRSPENVVFCAICAT